MNHTQKILLLIGAGLSLLMLLFPPFNFSVGFTANWTNLGYGFILTPPETPLGNLTPAKINSERLLLQLGGLWLIVSLLFVGLRSGSQNS
jgi:hypothetical protein